MVPGVSSVLWSLQRWLWHHRDTKLCGFAATHVSWAVPTVMMLNSPSLGVASSRGKSQHRLRLRQGKRQSSPGQRADMSWVVAISVIVLRARDLQEHRKAPLRPPGSPSHLVALWGDSCRHFLSLDVLLSAPTSLTASDECCLTVSHGCPKGSVLWGHIARSLWVAIPVTSMDR